MVPKEHEISLVVESDHSSSPELRLLGKQGSQEPADSNSHLGIKVVQDQFRHMVSCKTVPLDIFLKLNAGDFENCKCSFKMSDEQFPPMSKSHHNHMRVVESPGIFVHFLKFHLMSWIEIDVMEHHHEFFDHVVNFGGWLDLGSDKNFDRNSIIQDGIELIKLFFIILINLLLICNLFIFDGLRQLPLLFGQFLPLLSFFHFELVFLGFALGVNLDTLYFVFNIVGLDFDA